LVNVFKRYLMYVAAGNLGVVIRALFNMGTPKGLEAEGEGSPCAVLGGFVQRFANTCVVFAAVGRTSRPMKPVDRRRRAPDAPRENEPSSAGRYLVRRSLPARANQAA